VFALAWREKIDTPRLLFAHGDRRPASIAAVIASCGGGGCITRA